MIRRAAIVLVAAGMISACATARTGRTKPPPDIGVDDCAPGASSALLSVDALQCWFVAPHGRWRTLSHESHFDVLVVQTEALDLRDARDIARAFVENNDARRLQPDEPFSEILVYVRARSAEASRSVRTRRVRWTRSGGFESFEFNAP